MRDPSSISTSFFLTSKNWFLVLNYFNVGLKRHKRGKKYVKTLTFARPEIYLTTYFILYTVLKLSVLIPRTLNVHLLFIELIFI